METSCVGTDKHWRANRRDCGSGQLSRVPLRWQVSEQSDRGTEAGGAQARRFVADQNNLTRYRTLVDRILGMRLIYAQRSITPNVSFEFLNRQLVWEAFTVRFGLQHRC